MTDRDATLPPSWRRELKPTENGIYTGVAREDYEKLDYRVNWSTLKVMKKSPAHYRANLMKREKKDTDALKLGRAVHLAVLEPERFRTSYAVWDGERRAGKEWEAFKKKWADCEILREEDYQEAKAIAEAARNDRHAAAYLRDGAAEVTLLWTHSQPANGVPGFDMPCKGRMDFGAKAGVIVDLKTCRDGSPDGFSRAAWDLDYLAQAAFYVDGHAAASGTGEVLPYVIVAVEKEEPYVVQVYTVPEHLLDMGRELYRSHLARLSECRRESRWPGYSDGPMELPLPRWMRSDDASGLGLVFEEDAA